MCAVFRWFCFGYGGLFVFPNFEREREREKHGHLLMLPVHYFACRMHAERLSGGGLVLVFLSESKCSFYLLNASAQLVGGVGGLLHRINRNIWLQ